MKQSVMLSIYQPQYLPQLFHLDLESNFSKLVVDVKGSFKIRYRFD